jgi:phosphoglycolate phosphatase
LNKTLIFDFDGTLVDSKKIIYQCYQKVTKKIAPKRLSYAKNILIGPPLRDVATEILGQDNKSKLNNFIKLFISLHDNQLILNTQPYPNVTKTLKTLHENDILMSIATNKRQNPTLKLIDYYGWNKYFIKIECTDGKQKIRDKYQMIQDILKNNPEFINGYFVGDTVSDGISSNLSKIPFIKACYGYGENQNWGEVVIAKKINKISDLITY